MSELLPTGTVTLLLADVEGSTRLWETQPEAMSAAFARLDHELAELLPAHGGVRPVEQGEGDSFVLAFRRASDAVACALDLQRAALSPIRLRIGVHTGEVQLRAQANYIGPTINKTARIRDLGHGGQTLLSGTTEEMVVDRLPLDTWLTDLGTYPLKGVARPERVVQLCQADVRNEFPAATDDGFDFVLQHSDATHQLHRPRRADQGSASTPGREPAGDADRRRRRRQNKAVDADR